MQIHNQIRKGLQLDSQICLVLWYTIGLTLGLYAGFCISNPVSTYLYEAAHFVGAWPVVTTVLPLLFVWFFLWRDLPGLIYPVMFLKAFADGIIFIGIAHAFGSAAWLLGLLLIASDRIATVIQLWFASRILEGKEANLHRSFLLCLTAIISTVIFDRLVIAPYLISLMP
jgi:hypothetical protein